MKRSTVWLTLSLLLAPLSLHASHDTFAKKGVPLPPLVIEYLGELHDKVCFEGALRRTGPASADLIGQLVLCEDRSHIVAQVKHHAIIKGIDSDEGLIWEFGKLYYFRTRGGHVLYDEGAIQGEGV